MVKYHIIAFSKNDEDLNDDGKYVGTFEGGNSREVVMKVVGLGLTDDREVVFAIPDKYFTGFDTEERIERLFSTY